MIEDYQAVAWGGFMLANTTGALAIKWDAMKRRYCPEPAIDELVDAELRMLYGMHRISDIYKETCRQLDELDAEGAR